MTSTPWTGYEDALLALAPIAQKLADNPPRTIEVRAGTGGNGERRGKWSKTGG